MTELQCTCDTGSSAGCPMHDMGVIRTTHRKTLTQGGYRCVDQRIDLEFPLSLWQRGINEFVVLYGPGRITAATYRDAATEYGLCLLHALTCTGKLKDEAEIEA